MANILIIYSTTDGHTHKISWRLQQILQEEHHKAVLHSIEDESADIGKYDKVVIGASIRYGKHNPKVLEFIYKNEPALALKPSAFFSVNLVARKPEKNTPDTNPYLKKFLKQISWRPKALEVFAGKLDYRKYGFWDSLMIRLIMLMTGGPVHSKANIEYTNWERVEKFGRAIHEM